MRFDLVDDASSQCHQTLVRLEEGNPPTSPQMDRRIVRFDGTHPEPVLHASDAVSAALPSARA